MPRFFAPVLVLFLLFLALFVARCQAEPRQSDVLMAATHGVPAKGSFSRYTDDDVLEWRSRDHYRRVDGREVVEDGYGDCRIGNTATLFGLDNVFLFDAATRRPLLVLDDDTVVVLPRPVDRPQPDGPDAEQRPPEETTDESGSPEGGATEGDEDAAGSIDQFLRLDRSGYSAGLSVLRPDPDASIDESSIVDDDTGKGSEIRELDPEVLDYGSDDFPRELRDRVDALYEVRTLIPNRIDAGTDKARFVERATRLVNVVRAAGLTPLVGLDVALMPSQWHGKGGDDPTAAPTDAVSENLVEAAGATTAAIEAGSAPSGRLIWVADFGLPEGSDEGSWPANLDAGSENRQARPATDASVTPEFGHGLMVASVAAQAAPEAEIRVLNVSETNTVGDDWITVATIDAALHRNPELISEPGVLNLSIGAYDCRFDDLSNYAGPVMEGLWAVLEPYVADPELLVVAAAGNDGVATPMYPASFNGVIGVGATDATVLNRVDCLVSGITAWAPASATPDPSCQPFPDSPASFSNVGVNANVVEPGVDVIVDYPLYDPPIEYRYHRYVGHSAPLDTGRVRISGTSMAAPLFAACHLPDLTELC